MLMQKGDFDMTVSCLGKVAIVYPGDLETRRNAAPGNNRLASIFKALEKTGIHAEPAVYHDDFCDEVRKQLMKVDAVLVWMNPIQDGRDRTLLDAMLREVADAGVFVSTHPDIILKMGTKEVLYKTRNLGWGSDTHLYEDMEQMRQELPKRLSQGKARVLKQYRGNGGIGVWKVELVDPAPGQGDESRVLVRQGRRGCYEEEMTLADFMAMCEQYFAHGGKVIDQDFQQRLPEGMVRCYLVRDKVAGFGHQEIVALHPAPPGAPPTEAPDPTPRYYYPPDMAQWQPLRRQLEQEWVPSMQSILEIESNELPVLWDCDFLLGPETDTGQNTYVLCEINVSSVAPYPDTAPHYIANLMKKILTD